MITMTTTMVPNSPYPNIVASSGFLGFRIAMNHFGTVDLAMYVRFGTQFEQFVGTAVLLRRFKAGFIFLDRWFLVAFPHSLNSCKCGSIGFLLAELLSNGIPTMRHLARMFDTHISSISCEKPSSLSLVFSCDSYSRNHRFVTKTDQKRNCAKLNSQESWLFLKSSNVSRDVTDGPGKAGR